MSARRIHAIAGVLAHARADCRVVSLGGGRPAALDPATARAVADELYLSAGSTQAWKLGALDAEMQQRLGLDGPLVAPVLASGLRQGASEISVLRAEFVQPKLEPEVGVLDSGAGLMPLPCVEVADCRLTEWHIPRGWALADFGLQGSMIFGPPGALHDVIHVDVLHNGELLATAQRSWTDAVSRLGLLPPAVRAAVPYMVATGGMTPLYDAEPGRWEFRFHELSTITVNVS